MCISKETLHISGKADVIALYDAYIADVERLEEKSSPADGLLGMGSSVKSDSRHDQFAADLEKLLHELCSGKPSSREAREILEFIYNVPRQYVQSHVVYWMLLAVHGLTVELVSYLTSEDAVALRDGYVRAYRPWERLPSQKKALAALDRARKKHAG